MNQDSNAWTLVASVHRDEDVFEANLNASPALAEASELIVQRDFPTVCAAYNDALDRAKTDIVVFAHPDVYLPSSWGAQLTESLRRVEQAGESWGVLGLFGCTADGAFVGFTYSLGIGKFIGAPFVDPIPARTVDEFVFVVRRSSGIRFDESLPGPQSQLCATDVCLASLQGNMGVYVIPAFALHNSNGWRTLPYGFWKPYLYMKRKWKTALPVLVPYVRITRSAWPMVRCSLRHAIAKLRGGHRTRTRVADPAAYFDDLKERMKASFGS